MIPSILEQQQQHEMPLEQPQLAPQTKQLTSRQQKSNLDLKKRLEGLSRQRPSHAETTRSSSPTDFLRRLDLPTHLLQANDNDGSPGGTLHRRVPSSISIPGEDMPTLSSRGSRSSRGGSSKGGSSRYSSHRKRSNSRKEKKRGPKTEISSEERTSSSSVRRRDAHPKTKSQLLMDKIREEAQKECHESPVPLADLASMLLIHNQPECKSAC
jgi:hypothetical protein